MAHADTPVRCPACRRDLLVAREARHLARPITCCYCGARATFWQAQTAGRIQTLPHGPVGEPR